MKPTHRSTVVLLATLSLTIVITYGPATRGVAGSDPIASDAPTLSPDATPTLVPRATSTATPAPRPTPVTTGTPIPRPIEATSPAAVPLGEAQVNLVVESDADPVRVWSISVSGGSAGVMWVEVPDPSAGPGTFTVAINGPSATVEMVASVPANWVSVRGACVDQTDQIPIDADLPPQRFVLDVVAGHDYQCHYTSDNPGDAVIDFVYDTTDPNALTAWPIAVTGGSPSVDALTFQRDPDNKSWHRGAFVVAVTGQSATVDLTVPTSHDWVLFPGMCLVESASGSTDLEYVISPQSHIAFEVNRATVYDCGATADNVVPGDATDTPPLPPVPRTDALDMSTGPSPGGWPLLLAAVAGIVIGGLLTFRPARRRRLC